jgi:Tol biopolymer transport system component
MSVSSRGGIPTTLALHGDAAGDAKSRPTWPSFLPDGRRFLYLAHERGEAAAIYLGDSGSPGAGRRLVDSNTQAVFVQPGYLLFGRGTALVRQAFDQQSGQVTGDAIPIVDRLRTLGLVAFGEFSASSTGVLTYRSGVDTSTQFTWVDRKGNTLSSVGQPGRYRTSALSPDGTRVVYTDVSDGNLKILDLQSGITNLFTSDPGSETAPVWSSDGDTIYYRSDLGGAFAKAVNGSSPPVRLLDDFINGPTQFLNHPTRGPLLLYFQGPPFRPSMDILMLPLTGKREPQAVVSTQFGEAEPQVSPNGKWLAYASGDLGDYEIDVVPFLTDGPKVRVSRSGGRQPYWRADSRELFFVSDSRKFYALRIPDAGPSREIEPEFLFDMHANVVNARNSYIPSADGSRFLVITVLDTQDAPIHVVSNWIAAIQ